LAVNIAERAAFIATQPRVHISFDFAYMARKTQEMLNKSLDALVNMNTTLARKVCAYDDEVDAMYCQVYQILQEAIEAEPERTDTLIQLLSTARHLERIADHATNIAEDVIYMIEGEIVRHKVEEYRPQVHHR
jgi:phosphate transport system protein